VIDDGEYVCVLGPTGSGKSTLLRLISGLVNPDGGEIRIDGIRVNEIPPEHRNTALMPQNYALFPHMTAWENVAYGPTSRGVDPGEIATRVSALLKTVRLQDWAHAYPSQLSGGMQQRIALIRSLASGAKALLLDEPLGALDARLRLDLRRYLRHFAKDFGLTVVHVTHDQSEAISIADRIMLLRHGRVEQEGTPRAVYFTPRTLFAASFVGDRVLMEGVVREVHDETVTVEVEGTGSVRARARGLREGELTVVAIRCESLQLADHPTDSQNILSGRVVEIRPLGSYFRYSVELQGGNRVYSHVPALQGLSNNLSVGSDVYVCFAAQDALSYKYPERGLAQEVEAF
ncbi:MAG TPA: ABC transporter ATP-binding protein, partial [Thermoproteota archaeon]|nr:ABC transporter ATP-binding protein [Thermoproteota archaeon]